MYDGHLHARRAHAHLARWGTVAKHVGRPMVGRSYQDPSSSAQGPCDPTSLTAGGVFSPLHQATGLRRFALLFSGFCNAPSFFSPSGVTPVMRFLAGRCAAAHGLRATCIRRAESSGGLPATYFGGLQHFHCPHILSGRPSSQFCVNFLSVFVLFMFDVLVHILIFGSGQHLYASYIYVLCLPASCLIHLCSVFARLPHPFLHAFFLRISLCSFYGAPLTICLEGY
jgi:hypothetical protein